MAAAASTAACPREAWAQQPCKCTVRTSASDVAGRPVVGGVRPNRIAQAQGAGLSAACTTGAAGGDVPLAAGWSAAQAGQEQAVASSATAARAGGGG